MSSVETPEQARMGRPPKIDDARTEKVVAAILAGCTLAVSARAAGISKTTMRRWMAWGTRPEGQYAPYRDFKKRVKAAIAEWEVAAVKKINTAGDSDWRAQAWLLERRAPLRYARVSRNDALNATVNVMVTPEVQRKLFDDPAVAELACKLAAHLASPEPRKALESTEIDVTPPFLLAEDDSE